MPVGLLDHPHKYPALLLLLPLLPTNQPVTVKHLRAVIHQCSSCAGERGAPKSIWSRRRRRRAAALKLTTGALEIFQKQNKTVGTAAPQLARRRSLREVSYEAN